MVFDGLCLVRAQGQGEDMAVQLNEEEQLLVITRLHQVPHNHTCTCGMSTW